MYSVLVLDDHPVVGAGLALAFSHSRQFQLIGSVSEPSAGLHEVERLSPDALIADLVFKRALQLSAIAMFRALAPAMAILVYSSLPARPYAADAASAGADAFLSKEQDLSMLVARLSSIVPRPVSGQANVPIAVAPPARSPFGDFNLTPREARVAPLLARGLSVAAIGFELGIGAKTAAAHRDNIRRKLECRDTRELVARLARLSFEDHAHS